MKKSIAAIIAITLTFSTMQALPCSVYAVTETSQSSAAEEQKNELTQEEQMKKALTEVKSKITIPESYSDFSYSTDNRNNLSSYSFTWTNPADNRSYSARVTGDMITSYSHPDRYKYTNKPSVSSQKSSYFVNKAMSWVYKVNPSMKGFLKKSDVNIDLFSDSVSVQFERTYGGIKVSSNRVNVSLDKKTGEVLSYNCSWWQGAEFAESAEVLSQDEIKEIYCNEVSIKPYYRIYKDTETGKKKTSIVYTPQNSFIYNALNGEHSTREADYEKYMDTDSYDNGAALDAVVETDEAVAEEDMAEGGVSFTEQELAAAEELASMLTSAQFKEIVLKDKYMGVTEKYMMSNFSIRKNENAECGYAISCDMRINNKNESRNVDITADAKSGRIMSFYSYDSSSKEISVKKANSIADEALKYYFGDISGEYRADSENTAPLKSKGKYKETSREFVYNRYANNIQVSQNYIIITVTGSGKVSSVRSCHDRNVDFGDGLVISKETALELLCKQQDMTLGYNGFLDLTSKPHTYLEYTMPDWTLNAVNGKLCDYYGKETISAAKTSDSCPYTDIADSPYKKEIEALYEHNVRIFDGNKFNPDEKITWNEMNKLLDIVTGYGYEPMPLNDNAAGNSASKDGGYLTRMELAKEFTRAAKIDNVAKYSSIFKSPFTDVKDNDKNIGYAALAYGMGAVDGGKDGKFYPNAYVTREYAYHCAYGFIVNSSGE